MTLNELRVKWKPILNDNFITDSYRSELCERELFPALREIEYIGLIVFSGDEPYQIFNFLEKTPCTYLIKLYMIIRLLY